jgi:hypothetical protein
MKLSAGLVLTFLNSFTLSSGSKFGVDTSVLTTTDTWTCLMTQHNITYAKIRVYRSIGELDENCPATLASAYEAGIKNLDVYIFPCVSTSKYSTSNNIECESPADQVLRSIQHLEDNGIQVYRKDNTKNSLLDETLPIVSRFWFDIEDEDPPKYFDANPSVNQQLLSELTAAGEAEKIELGIYSTKTYWEKIMGNVEGYGGVYPLWYPRYDGVNSMEFFVPFADFTEVEVKQTGGDVGYCGVTQVDSDYMEG